MKNTKQTLKDLWFLIKQVDFIILFLTLFSTMYCLDYKLPFAMATSYVYTGFYFMLKRIVTGVGVSFLHLFFIFIIGLMLIPGGVFFVLSIFAKGV